MNAVPRLLVVLVGLIVVALLLYLGTLFILHDHNSDFLAIDRCLDRGGVWDYAGRACSSAR